MKAARTTEVVTTTTDAVQITMTNEEAGAFRLEVLALRDALAGAGLALELPVAEALVAAISGA